MGGEQGLTDRCHEAPGPCMHVHIIIMSSTIFFPCHSTITSLNSSRRTHYMSNFFEAVTYLVVSMDDIRSGKFCRSQVWHWDDEAFQRVSEAMDEGAPAVCFELTPCPACKAGTCTRPGLD